MRTPAADRELRIPGEAVARADQIPVVPVPPIPLGQANGARPPAPQSQPEIKQISTLPLPPTSAEAPAPPPSLPTPSLPTPPVASAPPPTNPASVHRIRPRVNVKQIVQRANDTFAHLDSYIARLTRREQINGKNKPEEVMLFKFRKQPWSVYFKWLGTEGHDREVIFVNGQHEGKIHTLLAAGDVPLMPAGKRMSLAPDGLLFKSASRYPITEAGLGASIDHTLWLASIIERGDKVASAASPILARKKRDALIHDTAGMVEHTVRTVWSRNCRATRRRPLMDLRHRQPICLYVLGR